MLQIDMEDVYAVLDLCVPYLVAIGVALVALIVVLVAARGLPKPKRFLARAQAAIACVLVVAISVNLLCLGPLATLIGLATSPALTVSDETTQEAKALTERITGEGFVLLENEEGALPLAEGAKVNLFGYASENPVYSGVGSGGINDLYEKVSIKDSLASAGIEYNEELSQFYADFGAGPEVSELSQSWDLPQPTVDEYSDELLEGAREFSDTAVIVISRLAGEGHNDMPTDMTAVPYDNNSDEYADFQAGDHFLRLSQTEKNMIEMVCENFGEVVVVYNGSNPMELGWVEDYDQIDAVIWAAGPGNTGFAALGRILAGEVNPSGRTPDTFVYDITTTPYWENAVKADYTNMADMGVDGMNNGVPQMYYPAYINYAESIYVGYKFYETAYAEAEAGRMDFDYDAAVQYPFGYGLSYTTFEQKMSDLVVDGDTVSFDVTVTNTGDVAGKDVVEVYFEPPYVDGGIEKAAANLIDYDKTEELEPGASETVHFELDVEDMASFDVDGRGCYVLDAGEYGVSIRANSHDVLDERSFSLAETEVFDESNPREGDDVAATSRFEDIAGDVTYLSRAGGFANYDEACAPAASSEMSDEQRAEYHLNSTFDYTTYLDPDAEMPTTGAENGLTLADLRDADYDDPRWDQLLDQMTVDEMVELISMSGYQTPAVESVGKAQTIDADGPTAINQNFTGEGSIGLPIPVVLASTWSPDLQHDYGELMGKMCREMGIEGWYAPGVNIHRSAFGARNYEFYSEDGTLSGLIAAEAVSGAQDQGVYAYVKHFALYDGNAKMVCVWADEQAAREIYLRAFEIPVKDAGANAVMVSWNFLGTMWSGENSELMVGVLRDEWGFRGMALTDFFRNNGHGFMNADAALANGVDAMLSTYGGGPNVPADVTDASTVAYMRQASKNIMYTVVSSWAYEDGAADAGLPAWQMALVGVDVALAAALVGCEVLTLRGYRRRLDK